MRTMRALLKAGRPVVADVEMAATFWRRAVGLLGRRVLPPGRGLWLVPCAAVHTFGMRFSLDLVFLDRELRVVRVVRNVPAGRLARGGGAHSVLEIAAGWLPAGALQPGDGLSWAAEINPAPDAARPARRSLPPGRPDLQDEVDGA